RSVCKLFQVFNAREGLRCRLFLQRTDVARAIVEELDEFGQGCWLTRLTEGRLARGVELFTRNSGGDAFELRTILLANLARGGLFERNRRGGIEAGFR